MTLFYVFAVVAVLASMLVIAQRNPIYSVLLLIGSFGALSGLYVLLDAPFVAVIQIIVYAGAIMVLFLFVVMLLNAPHEDTEFDERVHPLLRPGPMRFGAFLALVLAVELWWALARGGLWSGRQGREPRETREESGALTLARAGAARRRSPRRTVLPNLSPNERPPASGCGFALKPHEWPNCTPTLSDLVAVQAPRETAPSP